MARLWDSHALAGVPTARAFLFLEVGVKTTDEKREELRRKQQAAQWYEGDARLSDPDGAMRAIANYRASANPETVGALLDDVDSLLEQVRTLTAERDAEREEVALKQAALEGAWKEEESLRARVAELEAQQTGMISAAAASDACRRAVADVEAERDAAQQRANALKAEATRAAAELRHAFKTRQDWNLIARAIEVLERATTKEEAP